MTRQFTSLFATVCARHQSLLKVGSLFQLLLHARAERLWSLVTRSRTAERVSQPTSDLRLYPTQLRLGWVFRHQRDEITMGTFSGGTTRLPTVLRVSRVQRGADSGRGLSSQPDNDG